MDGTFEKAEIRDPRSFSDFDQKFSFFSEVNNLNKTKY